MKLRSLWKKAAVLTVAATAMLISQISPAWADVNVDWENQKITATGMGVPPANAVNAAQSRMMARRAAVVDGYRNLAEQVSGVQVDAESTVENMMVLSDVIRTKVSACVKGARLIEEQVMPDGSCIVKLEMPLFGVSSLADAVLTRPAVKEPFPDPVPEYEEDNMVGASLESNANVGVGYVPTVLPGQQNYAATYYYPHYQPPQSASYPRTEASPAAKPDKKKVKKQSYQVAGDYTSLVIDCSGMGLRPAMSPVIRNEQGDAIYGASNLDYDLVIEKGMAAYWNNLDVSSLSRAGNKPLVVKCTSLMGHNVNPVLAVPDANRVLQENAQSHFLDKLNVIFVR